MRRLTSEVPFCNATRFPIRRCVQDGWSVRGRTRFLSFRGCVHLPTRAHAADNLLHRGTEALDAAVKTRLPEILPSHNRTFGRAASMAVESCLPSVPVQRPWRPQIPDRGTGGAHSSRESICGSPKQTAPTRRYAALPDVRALARARKYCCASHAGVTDHALCTTGGEPTCTAHAPRSSRGRSFASQLSH